MDHSSEEGPGLPLLGELDPGHVRGTVHGGGGNLRSCHFCQISGTLVQHFVVKSIPTYCMKEVCFAYDSVCEIYCVVALDAFHGKEFQAH